ncbi:Retrovirus-related Pol polyprotein from type-1 retrotransposable element R1 3 [Eumeta japonica]|uniref:Retrovirus-related Pol polyprotein from type-1 retrotransposable element R1 3 n=1 Tax=Eumeta variegata TaxID=151549 RepID=A0A4C1XYD0_EUMVA|nr:Retrovirus-related Pol polyprotein from type-1 retrotransposable element R1 3 [Eumeta japonica]
MLLARHDTPRHAHIGTAGNERADELAKSAALHSDMPPDYDKVPLSYVKKRIRDESVLKWQDRYQSSSTTEVTRRFLPNVKEAFRAVRSSILTPTEVQVLTELGRIASYPHRFRFKNNPGCECNAEVEETVWHILLEYPRFLAVRL